MNEKKRFVISILLGLLGLNATILLFSSALRAHHFLSSGGTAEIFSLQKNPFPFVLEYFSISLIIISIALITKKSNLEDMVRSLLEGFVFSLFLILFAGFFLLLAFELNQSSLCMWFINLSIGALFVGLILGSIEGVISNKQKLKKGENYEQFI